MHRIKSLQFFHQLFFFVVIGRTVFHMSERIDLCYFNKSVIHILQVLILDEFFKCLIKVVVVFMKIPCMDLLKAVAEYDISDDLILGMERNKNIHMLRHLLFTDWRPSMNLPEKKMRLRQLLDFIKK